MGFLTTFTIYNDGISEIRKNSVEFCRNLHLTATSGKTQEMAHGSHGNLVKVQKTRHADDHTVYVHYGNSLCEMNTWSEETDELMKSHPEYFENMLCTMEYNAKELRKKLKAQKNAKKE